VHCKQKQKAQLSLTTFILMFNSNYSSM